MSKSDFRWSRMHFVQEVRDFSNLRLIQCSNASHPAWRDGIEMGLWKDAADLLADDVAAAGGEVPEKEKLQLLMQAFVEKSEERYAEYCRWSPPYRGYVYEDPWEKVERDREEKFKEDWENYRQGEEFKAVMAAYEELLKKAYTSAWHQLPGFCGPMA